MNVTAPTSTAPTKALTTRSARISNLDGYRAVAAIGVLVYHTAGMVGFLDPANTGAHLIDNLGNFGVAVFFLLSGVVIFLPFVTASLDSRAGPATAPFLIRRALRIFPGYWIALIAWALSTDDNTRRIGTVFGKILLLEPYDSRIIYISGLGVSWTLTIELSFYVLLPIYAAAVDAVARRRATPSQRLHVHLVGLAVLYVVPNVWRLLVDRWPNRPPGVLSWLPHFTDWFALGMLLAALFAWRNAGGRLPTSLLGLAERAWVCGLLAFACYCVVVVLKGDRIHFGPQESTAQAGWRMVFQGAAAFFALLPAVLGSARSPGMRLFNTRPAVFLGTISYGIYLWHTIVLLWLASAFTGLAPGTRSIVMTVAVLAITVPIAAASYYLVERPFSTLYRTRSARRGRSAGAPAT